MINPRKKHHWEARCTTTWAHNSFLDWNRWLAIPFTQYGLRLSWVFIKNRKKDAKSDNLNLCEDLGKCGYNYGKTNAVFCRELPWTLGWPEETTYVSYKSENPFLRVPFRYSSICMRTKFHMKVYSTAGLLTAHTTRWEAQNRWVNAGTDVKRMLRTAVRKTRCSEQSAWNWFLWRPRKNSAFIFVRGYHRYRALEFVAGVNAILFDQVTFSYTTITWCIHKNQKIHNLNGGWDIHKKIWSGGWNFSTWPGIFLLLLTIVQGDKGWKPRWMSHNTKRVFCCRKSAAVCSGILSYVEIHWTGANLRISLAKQKRIGTAGTVRQLLMELW